MLRYILCRNWKVDSGASGKQLVTVDGDANEVELLLRRGGLSENSYEFYSLVGVEPIGDFSAEYLEQPLPF